MHRAKSVSGTSNKTAFEDRTMFFAIFPPARPHKRARRFAFFVALVAIVGATPVHAQWKPDRTVEIVVGFAAGGGNDKSARVTQRIWKDTNLVDAVVVNKVGGGGALAYTYVSQKVGD